MSHVEMMCDIFSLEISKQILSLKMLELNVKEHKMLFFPCEITLFSS